MEITFFFMAKDFAIRDQKLEVASVGRIDRGAENLVDNAVADGEPKSATGVVSPPYWNETSAARLLVLRKPLREQEGLLCS